MKNIYLSQNQFKEFINSIDVNKNYYISKDESDEMPEWFNLKYRNYFDFPVALYAYSMIGDEKCPIMIFEDNNGEWKHVIVSYNPQVIEENFSLRDEQWEQIRRFIFINYEQLIRFSKLINIYILDDFEFVAPLNLELDALKDNWLLLKSCTNLPYDMLIEKEKYRNERVVSISQGNRKIYITIKERPKVYGDYKKLGITKEEIKQIKSFVKENKGLFINILEYNIGFRNDLILYLQQVDKNGKELLNGYDCECDYEIVWGDDCDIVIVKNEEGYFNYLQQYQQVGSMKFPCEHLISKVWFEEAEKFKFVGKDFFGIAKRNGCWAKVFFDGTLEYIGVED